MSNIMKKTIILAAMAILGLAACVKPEVPTTANVKVALTSEGAKYAVEAVKVTLTDGNINLVSETDAEGVASFENVAAGLWTASAVNKSSVDGVLNTFSGSKENITVVAGEDQEVEIALTKVETNQLVIKELYVGGCMDNEGAKNYANDKYIILYNNSELEADATDICFAMSGPLSASGANKYVTDGVYSFEAEGWMPALYAVWWFNTTVKIAPYSQIVVAITGAVDHTATYNKSVDLSKADYCMYDPEQFNLAASYPAPAAGIPETNYLKTYKYGQGTAWPIHMSQASLFIFKMSKAEVEALSKNSEAYDHTLGTSAATNVVKIPAATIVDAIEVWDSANIEKSTNRFPASYNQGYVASTSKAGYSLYRNVDKEATEAIEENKDKLVYNYALGTNEVEATGTTDPSGIDAEASIAAGAKIVYSETNNTTVDFHQRKVASIKK